MCCTTFIIGYRGYLGIGIGIIVFLNCRGRFCSGSSSGGGGGYHGMMLKGYFEIWMKFVAVVIIVVSGGGGGSNFGWFGILLLLHLFFQWMDMTKRNNLNRPYNENEISYFVVWIETWSSIPCRYIYKNGMVDVEIGSYVLGAVSGSRSSCSSGVGVG